MTRSSKKAIEGYSRRGISTRYIKNCKKDMANIDKTTTTTPGYTGNPGHLIDASRILIDKG